MPTLFRLLITLLFLAGLVYAGMIALVAFVEPTPKETTIRIPQRELLGGGQPALPGTAAPVETASAATPAPAAQPAPAETPGPTSGAVPAGFE
jgi:hypothetical protein